MKRKDKNIILILSFVIIIIFVTLIFLFATNIISFNWNFNDNNSVITDLGEKNENDNEVDNDNGIDGKVDNATNVVDITLPSGKVININDKYKKVFDGSEKIIAIDFNGKNIGELTMSTFISNRLADYPDNFYTGKKVSVSNTVFDFDGDGVNEIMLSFCEEFILLHYYNGRVYGYSLGGYRNNMDWSIEGVAANSGSVVEFGYKKYSFNGSELVSKNIASSGYENIEVSYDLKYEVEGKVVNKDTFIAYVEKLNKVERIKYVEYSK